HDRAERAPIDRPVGGDDGGPERVDDRGEARASGPVDLVTDAVGVDHARAELGEDRGDGALARADAAREPYNHEPPGVGGGGVTRRLIPGPLPQADPQVELWRA